MDRSREYTKLQQTAAETRDLAAMAHDDAALRQLAVEEIQAIEARAQSLEEEIQRLLIPKDPNDDRNVVLEIRAGTGGDEAALFAADLFRMYSRYAERHRWKVEVLSTSSTGVGGIKEVIATIEGKGVYRHMKHESGVHRVQRVPVDRSERPHPYLDLDCRRAA